MTVWLFTSYHWIMSCILMGPSNAVTQCVIASHLHLTSSASGCLFSGLCSRLWHIATFHRRSSISSWETLLYGGWGAFIRKLLELSCTDWLLFFFLKVFVQITWLVFCTWELLQCAWRSTIYILNGCGFSEYLVVLFGEMFSCFSSLNSLCTALNTFTQDSPEKIIIYFFLLHA